MNIGLTSNSKVRSKKRKEN